MPAVQLRLSSIYNNSLATDISRLNETIDERARQISEKCQEYNKLVGIAVGTGILFSPEGIFFGVKAEAIRNQLNRLKEQQRDDIQKLSGKHTTLGSLHRTRDMLQNLELIVIDADVSTKNMAAVWNTLDTYVQASSVEQFDGLIGQALLAGAGMQQTLSAVAQYGERVSADDASEVIQFVQTLRTLSSYIKGLS